MRGRMRKYFPLRQPRLLAGLRLRDVQLVHVHAEVAGVLRVQRVLDVDESRGAPCRARQGQSLGGVGERSPRRGSVLPDSTAQLLAYRGSTPGSISPLL